MKANIINQCMVIFVLLSIYIISISQASIENSQEISFQDFTTNSLTLIPVHELQPGDIAFKHPEAFPGPIIIDHCLLCAGYDNETEEYEFIEAHFHYGVQSRFEKKENLTDSDWGPYARVRSATEEQKKNAIDFARKQIGKDFQIEWINKNYDPTDIENDSLAKEWYCSELVWASYYNCNNKFPSDVDERQCVYGNGIDIDMNGWQKVLNMTIVAPKEIMFDNDVTRLILINHENIDTSYQYSVRYCALQQFWDIWKIKIFSKFI